MPKPSPLLPLQTNPADPGWLRSILCKIPAGQNRSGETRTISREKRLFFLLPPGGPSKTGLMGLSWLVAFRATGVYDARSVNLSPGEPGGEKTATQFHAPGIVPESTYSIPPELNRNLPQMSREPQQSRSMIPPATTRLRQELGPLRLWGAVGECPLPVPMPHQYWFGETLEWSDSPDGWYRSYARSLRQSCDWE